MGDMLMVVGRGTVGLKPVVGAGGRLAFGMWGLGVVVAVGGRRCRMGGWGRVGMVVVVGGIALGVGRCIAGVGRRRACRTGGRMAAVLGGSLARSRIVVVRRGLRFRCRSFLRLEPLAVPLTECLGTGLK